MKNFSIRYLAIVILALTSLFVQSYSLAAEKSVIAVVVANDTPEKTISPAELRLIYWRKKTYWSSGQRLHPVNLPADHALRLQFSRSVLGSLPATQNDYWNGQYFHGISPPHVVYSEEAVIRYVQDTTGSVGYVDACSVDTRIRAVLWIMPNGDIHKDMPSISCN